MALCINREFSLQLQGITLCNYRYLYSAANISGQRFRKCSMNKAIDMANMRKKSYVWLGVWEKNDKAICFIERMGFMKSVRIFFHGRRKANGFHHA
jgi:GNAT superfamily N-acetyltransferase